MRILFPEIIEKNKTENKAILDIFIPKDLFYFKGHFPENPILPGITQLHWAVHYAKNCFNISGVITHCPSIKFTDLINPQMNLTLSLENFTIESYITYEYKHNEKKYSIGRLYYK
jgi:3-hydroxymyristoyl/3-hydroxydecanoyl-(acyl carrier protein) dehydratase